MKSKKLYGIIIFLILIIIFLLGVLIGGKKNMSYTSSVHCLPGEVMDSWIEFNDGRLYVKSCSFPKKCPPGQKREASCGPFADRVSCFYSCMGIDELPVAYKPVIYLYPEKTMDVEVNLSLKGKIIADYPKYDEKIKGWKVTASPDGSIINKTNNKSYSYLFWEGIPSEEIDRNLDSGFVVQGSDARKFLEDILPKMGLSPKEYNEFIVYWYPILQKNHYNLIHFSTKQYSEFAPLQTTPKYDSILRVFMVVKPLSKPISILPQIFPSFERKGFTVIEWGGTILKQ